MNNLDQHECICIAHFLSENWDKFVEFCEQRGIRDKDAGRIIDDLQDDPL